MAIQREIRNGAEGIDYLRHNGGAAKDLSVLTERSQHDNEFMMKLQERFKTDHKMSLTLCAVLESYQRIRDERDRHETPVAADGGMDP